MNLQKIAITTALALGLSSASFADHHNKKNSVKQGAKTEKVLKKKKMQKRRKAMRACFGKLTQDQRKQLRANRIERVQLEKKLKRQLKKARASYKKVVANADSTKKEARMAMKKVQQKRSQIIKLRTNARTNIMYDVLETEQRVKAIKCMNKNKKMKMKKKANLKKKMQERRAKRIEARRAKKQNNI